MRKTQKISLFAMSALAFVIAAGCDPQPSHPNQLNAFDGAAYNSLTLAHAALASFRAQISSTAPQYIPAFNEAVAGYGTAFDAYARFRAQTGNQAAAGTALASLTASIVSLENAFITGIRANSQEAEIRHRASIIRARAKKNLTVSDILTELQIAAALAGTIPAGQPYSQIAAIVIEATTRALEAEKATTGQPIDLASIQPVLPIQ
ncbi:MAG TPA: hypothetical protein VH601_01800 [Bryobacteraceae bacterium]|jgi:hypothetical protein